MFVGFHQIRDLKCNEAVLNIAVLPCNCAVKGCSVRGKKQVLIIKVSKALLCGKLILISHPAERYNVTFGFSRVKVETTELNILLFPVLNGYIEL